MNRLDQSYLILDQLRLPHGMYLASPSNDYSYVWLRDSFYEVLPYLNEDCDRYEKTYHRILDLFDTYKDKIMLHTSRKPVHPWEYIHARYEAEFVEEIDTPWGHAQHDAIGAVLFGIAEGIRAGKPIIRNDHDLDIIQMVVNYLGCCEYWEDKDNGMWEENTEVHMSSVGACVAGLEAVQEMNLAYVPDEWIEKGLDTIDGLFPRESVTKDVDLAQLSLIYPYNILSDKQARVILDNVTEKLLRWQGVIRYEDDSYYSTLEAKHGRYLKKGSYLGTEAEWTFGLPWLALVYLKFGDLDKARMYVKRTENVMLSNGALPELYYAGSTDYNGNTPLGWSNSLYILAKEAVDAFR